MPALRELGRGGRLGALTLLHLRVRRACGNLELELDKELHQATLSRWLRPRASSTRACRGATSSLALSEPNGSPTDGRGGRGASGWTGCARAGAPALGLAGELGDGLRDIVWIGSVLALERRSQGFEHRVGNAADRA